MATSTQRQRGTLRLRGRSYMAFALVPEPPLADWLSELDRWLSGSRGFFTERPVVLDLTAVTLTGAGIAHLIAELKSRGVRVMGLENVPAEYLDGHLPPLLMGGRQADADGRSRSADDTASTSRAGEREATSLVIESAVRSGQTVFFPAGDVVVLGTVSSGAELVAGGSIHIYGTLRGRALAGTSGNSRSRIYCRRLEAELLAIDGYYRTAEDLDGNLRGRAVQAWLAGESLLLAPME
jgi:septum site-determining protein MinC